MASRPGAIPPGGARYWDVALFNAINSFRSIFWHEADMHHGRRLMMGYLAAGAEPLFIVLVLNLLFTMLARHTPYGRSSLLFLGTGVYPIYMFIHTSIRMRSPLGRGKYRVQFPMERPLFVLFSNALQHYITYMCVILVFFGALYISGVDDAIPYDPVRALEAITGVYLIGFGAGIVNAIFGRMFPVWDLAWPAISRTVLHFSGLYYVAAYLPPTTRYYLLFNPVLSGTNWFRMAFYPFYPAAHSGAQYVIFCGMGLVTFGLLLEANTRQYLEAKE